MNKKLLIMVGKKDEKKELFSKLITERLGKDIGVTLAVFSDLFIELDGNKIEVLIGDKDIREFDLVYFRRIDHSLFPLSGSLAMCLDKFGIKYFDTKFKEIGAGGDKFTSLVKLSIAKVRVAKTIFCPREKILEKKDLIISKLNFPIIAKDTSAQGNTGIFVLKKEEDFEALLKLREKRLSGTYVQFIFQQFLQINREYRLLVLGNSVRVVHKKDKRSYKKLTVTYEVPDLETEFVNIKQIPSSLKKISVKAAKILNIEIAGVDACQLEKDSVPIIIEVNRGPGFEYDTDKSPEIIEVADFLKNSLKNKWLR